MNTYEEIQKIVDEFVNFIKKCGIKCPERYDVQLCKWQCQSAVVKWAGMQRYKGTERNAELCRGVRCTDAEVQRWAEVPHPGAR
jgi:hypothetical protein